LAQSCANEDVVKLEMVAAARRLADQAEIQLEQPAVVLDGMYSRHVKNVLVQLTNREQLVCGTLLKQVADSVLVWFLPRQRHARVSHV